MSLGLTLATSTATLITLLFENEIQITPWARGVTIGEIAKATREMMAAMMTAAWRIGRLMAVVAVVSGAPAHMVHDHMSDESTLGARILAASEGLRFQKTRIPEDAEYEQKYVSWNPSRGSASKGGGDVCEQDWGECVHGLGCYSSCYDGSGSVCCSKHGVKSDGLCKYDHD